MIFFNVVIYIYVHLQVFVSIFYDVNYNGYIYTRLIFFLNFCCFCYKYIQYKKKKKEEVKVVLKKNLRFSIE